MLQVNLSQHVLVVSYGCEPSESETVQTLLKRDDFDLLSITIFNNGPNLWEDSEINPLLELNVSIFQNLNNISLSKIYNYFIRNSCENYFCIFDHDTDVSNYVFNTEASYDLYIPRIYCNDKIVFPKRYDNSVIDQSCVIKSNDISTVTSGMNLSRKLIVRMLLTDQQVFDEHYSLYGIDTSFLINLSKLKIDVCVQGEINHDLSSQSDDISHFRAIERMFDAALTMRNYFSYGSILNVLSHWKKFRNEINSKDRSNIIKVLLTGRHPRSHMELGLQDNKSVIFMNNAYYPSIGGVENSLKHLTQSAAKSNYSSLIFCGDLEMSPGDFKEIELSDKGLVLRYKTKPSKIPILSSLFSYLEIIRKLKKLKTLNSNQIVVARHHTLAYLSVLVGFKKVRYLVPSIISNQIRSEFGVAAKYSIKQKLVENLKCIFNDYLQRKALLKSDSFVFSETMRLQCSNLLKVKTFDCPIVKPGIDPNRFYPTLNTDSLKNELGLPLGKKLLLVVGRLVKAKGINYLIDALTYLPEDYAVVIVGEGTEYDNLMCQAKDLQVNHRVLFTGKRSNTEDYYRIADSFIMSSIYEPLGQTILEALGSGLPIVAFDPSIKEVDTAIKELDIEQFVSYAPVLTGESLANAISKIGADFKFEKASISNLAYQKFSWDTLLEQLIK